MRSTQERGGRELLAKFVPKETRSQWAEYVRLKRWRAAIQLN